MAVVTFPLSLTCLPAVVCLLVKRNSVLRRRRHAQSGAPFVISNRNSWLPCNHHRSWITVFTATTKWPLIRISCQLLYFSDPTKPYYT